MANFPFWSSTFPSVYRPTETYTVFSYLNSELIIHRDRLEINGNIRHAAFALVEELLFRTDSFITSWNNILRAKHGNDEYTLEYLGEEEPIFFQDLKFHYEDICRLKVFT